MRYLVLGLITLMLFSCRSERDENGDMSKTGELLQGEHLLRRFKVKTTTEKRWSGSYFLIGGGASGGTYTHTEVSFSFQLPDSTYAMATQHLKDIRIKLDSNINVPYVTFRWEHDDSEDIGIIMKHNVLYMVVHCKEEDFPMDVQIDQL